jgi:hypothetical protein
MHGDNKGGVEWFVSTDGTDASAAVTAKGPDTNLGNVSGALSLSNIAVANGDGTVDQTTTGLATQYHAMAGNFTAQVTVIDKDGGQASATTALTRYSRLLKPLLRR